MKSNHPAGLLIILLGLVFLAIGSHVTPCNKIKLIGFETKKVLAPKPQEKNVAHKPLYHCDVNNSMTQTVVA